MPAVRLRRGASCRGSPRSVSRLRNSGETLGLEGCVALLAIMMEGLSRERSTAASTRPPGGCLDEQMDADAQTPRPRAASGMSKTTGKWSLRCGQSPSVRTPRLAAATSGRETKQ